MERSRKIPWKSFKVTPRDPSTSLRYAWDDGEVTTLHFGTLSK
jgi:hypothetical protein